MKCMVKKDVYRYGKSSEKMKTGGKLQEYSPPYGFGCVAVNMQRILFVNCFEVLGWNWCDFCPCVLQNSMTWCKCIACHQIGFYSNWCRAAGEVWGRLETTGWSVAETCWWVHGWVCTETTGRSILWWWAFRLQRTRHSFHTLFSLLFAGSLEGGIYREMCWPVLCCG